MNLEQLIDNHENACRLVGCLEIQDKPEFLKTAQRVCNKIKNEILERIEQLEKQEIQKD